MSRGSHHTRFTRRLAVEPLEGRYLLDGAGLVGQYFHNADFTGVGFEHAEAIDFDWGTTNPAPGVAPSTYSVRWIGQLEPQFSQTFTFYVTSQQGVRLWVDGQLLVDDWQNELGDTATATITLTAGQKVDVRLDYGLQSGDSSLRLEWSSASLARQVIPAARLYAPPAGLLGNYSDSVGNQLSRIDPHVDFNWGTRSPQAPLAVDNFAATWSGYIRGDVSGTFTFGIESDEGARLWIGGQLVIDDWQPHLQRTTTGTFMLEAGKWYDIRLEYYEGTASAEVSLLWATPANPATLVAVPSTNLRAAERAELTFNNPLGPGQDPFVTRWNDHYLHVRSGGGRVWIDWADQLEQIHPDHPASSTVIAWTAPLSTNYSQQIWAPELHQIDGKWYIFVAASNGQNSAHRMHVLERDDASPLGAFTYRGQIDTAGPGIAAWAIDGTTFEWQGTRYFVWSGWPAPGNPGAPESIQNLYISAMSNPWTLTGPKVLLSTATQSWERASANGPFINEGPQALINGNHLHLTYSANGYWMDQYAIGLLTYNGTGSLLNAASWSKNPQPVFSQAGDIVGTGHASFTTSPDGTENWIVYHAHHDADNWQDDRDIYIQPFQFGDDGKPQFGSPVPAIVPIAVPSGSAQPNRTLIAGDFDASGFTDRGDHQLWRQLFGSTLVPGISADGNGDGIVDAADYTVWRDGMAVQPPQPAALAYWRHEEGAVGGLVAGGANAVLDSSANGQHMRTLNPATTAASYSANVSPLPLRSGLANTRSLDFGPGGDGGGRNDDNFTSGAPIEGEHFAAITVEFAFNLSTLNIFQTLVGKDGRPTPSPVAPLQIKVRGDSYPGGVSNQLFVEWIDGDGDVHFLASGQSMAIGDWYHMAFVLTGEHAHLYLSDESGVYLLVDEISGADFAGPASEVLFNSTGTWSVGRGSFNGNATDWSDAFIDEVRITDSELHAGQFLFTLPPVSAAINAAATPELTALATPVKLSYVLGKKSDVVSSKKVIADRAYATLTGPIGDFSTLTARTRQDAATSTLAPPKSTDTVAPTPAEVLWASLVDTALSSNFYPSKFPAR